MEALLLIAFWISLLTIIAFIIITVVHFIKKDKAKGIRQLKWAGISFAVTIASFIGLGFIEGARQENQVAEETITTTKQQVNAESKTNKPAAEKKVAEKETKTTDGMYYLTEEAAIEGVAYKVDSVKTSKEVAGYTSQSGTYLIVTLTVRNDSDKAIMLNNGDFIVLIDGAEYEDDPTTSAYHDGGFLLDSLNPKMSKTASVVYEVPSNVSEMPIMLQIKPNRFKKDKLIIQLEDRS